MTASTDQASLADTLSGFAQAIRMADDPREGVSVEVVRRHQFQNEALTPGGRRVLLDEPVHFGGRGEAPDPAEYLLAAVGASLSVTLTAHAALNGVPIDAVRVALAAEIDGNGFFAPGGGAEPGLLDVKIRLEIDSPAEEARVRAMVDLAWSAAPVLRSLRELPRLELVIRESVPG